MLTVLRFSLARNRGQILGWGLTLFALGLMMVSFFDTIEQAQDQFNQLLEVYPEEFLAFFGDITAMTTPKGYLEVELFSYLPLILGIFAAMGGSGLIVGDEEGGRLDMILGQPVSRSSLFFGRLLGLIITSVLISAFGWLGIVIPMSWSSMEIGLGELILPFIAVLAVIWVFGTFALLLSFLMPSRRLAGMLSGVLLAVSFFLTGLSRLSEDLEPLADFSPMTYYQGGDAFNGLNWEWNGGLIAISVLFILLAWWAFVRRDLRVGGEGGWKLPFIRPRKLAAARGITGE
jgi:ABC-2 type transport system permease protein